MATYIGKRIVPVHCGKWDLAKTYEMLSIVLEENSGDSYIMSRDPMSFREIQFIGTEHSYQ